MVDYQSTETGKMTRAELAAFGHRYRHLPRELRPCPTHGSNVPRRGKMKRCALCLTARDAKCRPRKRDHAYADFLAQHRHLPADQRPCYKHGPTERVGSKLHCIQCRREANARYRSRKTGKPYVAPKVKVSAGIDPIAALLLHGKTIGTYHNTKPQGERVQ